MDRLRYVSTERMYEGVLVDVTDAGVTIDLKGRLGQLMIPKRMLISDHEPAVGQVVGFMMSYPEVLNPEPDEKYVASIEANKKRMAEIKSRYQNKSEE